MPSTEQAIVDLLVEQSLAMARTLVQCAEPVKAWEFLTSTAPACVLESKEVRRFVLSLEKQIDQYFSDEKYIERYAGYTNEQTNPIEPFSDKGLLNLFRAKKAREEVERLCASRESVKVLDIGAGDCTLEHALLQEFQNLNVDVSELLKVGGRAALALQELFPGRVGIEGRFDVGEVPQEPKYDLVLCLEVIEHVTDPVRLLRNMRRVLKPGGMILVSTPNHVAWIERKLIDQFGDNNWYHHVRAYTPMMLNQDAMEAGFKASILAEPSGTLCMLAGPDNDKHSEPTMIHCHTPKALEDAIRSAPPGSVVYSPFKLNENGIHVAVLGSVVFKNIEDAP